MPARATPLPPIPCLYCQRSFVPTRKDARWCGNRCKQAADRARRNAATKHAVYRSSYYGDGVYAAGMAAGEAHTADFRVVCALGPSTRGPSKRTRDRDARYAAERAYWDGVRHPTPFTPSPATTEAGETYAPIPESRCDVRTRPGTVVRVSRWLSGAAMFDLRNRVELLSSDRCLIIPRGSAYGFRRAAPPRRG